MNIIGIIPARMASSRFPGKPLAKICGLPMIGHVYLRSCLSRRLSEVYVATCDDEIKSYVEDIGGRAIMTLDSHEGCTDRTSEALLKIESEKGAAVDVVVMIQGDEPMITPDMIDATIPPLEDTGIDVVNLILPINEHEHEDPNVVKVVTDLNGFALYFSREAIPSRKKGGRNLLLRRQTGIISFRREFLLGFNTRPRTPLESIESIDMLRVLEEGGRIKTVFVDAAANGVDTPEDLANVERVIAADALLPQYLRN